MLAPTPRQLAIVAFWHAFTDEHGYPPTLREACVHFGWTSTNAVTCHVALCANKGLLLPAWLGHSRGITVTALGRSIVGAAPPPAPPSNRHRHPRTEVRVRRELLCRRADAMRRVREGGVMRPFFCVEILNAISWRSMSPQREPQQRTEGV